MAILNVNQYPQFCQLHKGSTIFRVKNLYIKDAVASTISPGGYFLLKMRQLLATNLQVIFEITDEEPLFHIHH